MLTIVAIRVVELGKSVEGVLYLGFGCSVLHFKHLIVIFARVKIGRRSAPAETLALDLIYSCRLLHGDYPRLSHLG